MARPDFETTLRAQQVSEGWWGTTRTTVMNSELAKEKLHVVGPERRKPKGFIPPEPYEFERTRYARASGIIKYTNKIDDSTSFRTKGCVGGYGDLSDGPVGGVFDSLNSFNEAWTFDNAFSSQLRNGALIKARQQMKSSDINLGVAFAERNRTAKLVGDTALSLVNAYRDLRRGDWRSAGRELGLTNPKKPRGSSLPQKWLEYQYGWKPLLSDVYGSTRALAERESSDWLVTGKGSMQSPVRVRGQQVGSFFDWQLFDVHGMEGCYVRIDAEPQNDILMAFTSLGITNPLLIGWELVPFSFVVDWFLPVGNFLESLDAMLGYGPTWCSISQIQRANWYGSGNTWEDDYSKVELEYSSSKQYVRLKREVSTEVPLPTLPVLKNPVSLGHMANGLSLLASVFGGRR